MKKLPVILALAIAALALNAAVASAAKVRNGGFEHNLRGWTQNSDESGEWDSVLRGGEPFPLLKPKRGQRQAIVTQGDPGAHIITQNVKLRSKRRHRLSMWVQYSNEGGIFASPDTFDIGTIFARSADAPKQHRGVIPSSANQQLRIEVLRAKAPVRTTKRRQILATVLRTMPGDPLSMSWTRFHVNLSKYAGKRVKLRIAEVDNLGEFVVGVDGVKVKSKKKKRRRGK